MLAAICMPEPEPISAAVLAAERLITAEEGRHHVNGSYFRSESDAAQQRRWEAERRVRHMARHRRRCTYCNHPILPGEETVTMAGAEFHKTCALDAWYDSASYPTEAEMGS